jgi:hypothetical protein
MYHSGNKETIIHDTVIHFSLIISYKSINSIKSQIYDLLVFVFYYNISYAICAFLYVSVRSGGDEVPRIFGFSKLLLLYIIFIILPWCYGTLWHAVGSDYINHFVAGSPVVISIIPRKIYKNTLLLLFIYVAI